MADKLGTLLRRLREDKKGWTIGQLSQKTGIPVPTISKIERGETESPGVESLFKLADALDEDVRVLFAAMGLNIPATNGQVSLRRRLGDLLDIPLYAPPYDKITTYIYIPRMGDIMTSEGLRALVVENAEFIPTISPNDVIMVSEKVQPGVGAIVGCFDGNQLTAIGRLAQLNGHSVIVNNVRQIAAESCEHVWSVISRITFFIPL